MKTRRFQSNYSKLALLVTLLFLVEGILLAVFLNASAVVLGYQEEARATYTRARQLYQVKRTFQQFESALNRYELSSDPDLLDEYNSSYFRVQGYLASVTRQAERSGSSEAGAPQDGKNASLEAQRLRELSADIEKVRQQFDQVIDAVDEEDWEAAYELDDEAYSHVLPDIYAQIDRQIEARNQVLDDLRARVRRFSTLGRLALLLALPAFLLLVVIAVLYIARQVQAPLVQMQENLTKIEKGRFQATDLGRLPQRSDEIGFLAREYLHMAESIQQRHAALQAEAQDIRARTR